MTIPPDLKQLYDRNQALIRDHILDGCPHVIVELIERIGRNEAPVSDEEREEWFYKLDGYFCEYSDASNVNALIAARSKL